MKKSKILPVFMTIALFTAGCESMSPGENAAVIGGTAAAITGGVLALAGVDPRIVIPVAAGAAILAGGAAYAVSKHQATARQRQVALQNARAAEARLLAQQRAAASASRTTTGTTARSASKKAPANIPQFIAVDTVSGPESPANHVQHMVYDTQSKKLVGNNVYSVPRSPKPGSTVKYDTMAAQYVGR
jgi:type II secretory pathway pseudopilin PulG